MTKSISLLKNGKPSGKFCLVDDSDFDDISKFVWRLSFNKSDKFYAVSSEVGFMHRFLLDAPGNMKVDHKDGDGLNNTRSNIRICTQAQNCANRKTIGKNNKSGYKGVYFNKSKNKWRAMLKFNKKEIHLGYFSNPVEAAHAYDNAALKYFGEFSKANFAPTP